MRAIPNYYVITCPDCRGRMFITGVLCPTCDGNGRLVIPEHPQYHHTAKRALRITLFVAALILVVVAIAVNR